MKPLLFFLIFISLGHAQQKTFSEAALNDVLLTENQAEVTLGEVLQQYHGKTIFIDVWASWCKDCIVGMPKVQKLREDNPEVIFLFLSLDKETESWKHGIQKYGVVGKNYFIPSGWKGPFCASIDLDWIPRYMIVNPEGEISLYKAIVTDDEHLLKELD